MRLWLLFFPSRGNALRIQRARAEKCRGKNAGIAVVSLVVEHVCERRPGRISRDIPRNCSFNLYGIVRILEARPTSRTILIACTKYPALGIHRRIPFSLLRPSFEALLDAFATSGFYRNLLRDCRGFCKLVNYSRRSFL